MSDIDSIFDPDITEDEQLHLAGALLEKVAADEGLDLNSASQSEFDHILAKIARSAGGETKPDSEPQTKEAAMSEQISPQEVHIELTKSAALRNIDIGTLSEAEYREAFHALAEEMTQPDWAEKVAARDELLGKMAEAEAMGEIMASTFLSKIAEGGFPFAKKEGDEEKKDEDKKDEKKDEEEKKEASMAALKNFATNAASKVRGAASKATETVGQAVTGVGRAAGSNTEFNKRVGRRVLGVGAATGAAGAAAGAASRGKQASEELTPFQVDAIKTARLMLEESGIDPDAGAEPQPSDADYNDKVAEAAIALLAEHGFIG
jgi:hypothetical protein